MINIADILKDIPIYERRFWSPVGLKIGKLSVIKEVEPAIHPNGKRAEDLNVLAIAAIIHLLNGVT